MQLSNDHRNALFYALKKNEIDANILVAKFTELVANLDTNFVYNMLFFQDSEFPNEDVIEKNLGLYICVNVEGVLVKNALIDTDSNVNICLVELLQRKFLWFMQKKEENHN